MDATYITERTCDRKFQILNSEYFSRAQKYSIHVRKETENGTHNIKRTKSAGF